MTFQELIETFIEDLDEDINDTEFYDKAKKWINRAYKELCKKERPEKVISTTAVNNEINRPSDYIKILEVLYEGENIVFHLEGRKIKVPVDGDVNVVYAYMPESMEDLEDEPATNPSNDEFILNYAKYLYLMAEEEPDRALTYKQMCDTYKVTKYARTTKTANIYGW